MEKVGCVVKCLITGTSGQLGRSLAEYFSCRGIEVIPLSRNECDITNGNDVARVFLEYSPTIVINAAAWTDVDAAEDFPEEAFRVNAIGAGILSKFSNEYGAPIFHISSDMVFSGQRNTPWTESDFTNPNSVYGKSKVAGEILVKEHSPKNSYIIRTAWLYGKWGDNFVKKITRQLESNESEISVVGDQFGQPTYVMDLTEKIFELIILKPGPGTYHATNSGVASRYEFACEIARKSGYPPERIKEVNSDGYSSKASRPHFSVLAHQSFDSHGIQPMRDWRLALGSALPNLI